MRKDFIKKITTELASYYKHICLENHYVKGMIQNGKLAASIARLGFLSI